MELSPGPQNLRVVFSTNGQSNKVWLFGCILINWIAGFPHRFNIRVGIKTNISWATFWMHGSTWTKAFCIGDFWLLEENTIRQVIGNEDLGSSIIGTLLEYWQLPLLCLWVTNGETLSLFSITWLPPALSPQQQNCHSLPLQVTWTSVWPCDGWPAVSLFSLWSSQQSARRSTIPVGLQEHMDERT